MNYTKVTTTIGGKEKHVVATGPAIVTGVTLNSSAKVTNFSLRAPDGDGGDGAVFQNRPCGHFNRTGRKVELKQGDVLTIELMGDNASLVVEVEMENA